MSLAGKVVLITGSSSGIGRACAERAAQEGASVVINYRSSADEANALVKSIGSDRALAVQADVSKLADLDKLVEATVAKFGKIDTLMPNAGVMPMRTVQDTTEAEFDSTFAMNVKQPYFLVQKALPHMPRGSRVILVSTGVCHNSGVTPNYLLYASTKGAVEQMARLMSKGLAANGITVNALGPGPTGTDLFYKGKSEALVNTLKAASPFNRIGEPEEIGNVFKFLCSDDSSWVTGQVLLANGGAFV